MQGVVSNCATTIAAGQRFVTFMELDLDVNLDLDLDRALDLNGSRVSFWI